jgi:NAD(P)-dependent dehydrogenase (short-subunit alcohol dehydrogenase family)
LITGANSGIGLATAVELARHGFRSIGSVRSEEKAEVVARAAKDRGVEVDTVLLDVADADQCERVMSGLRLYGLINNAGYMGIGAVEDVTDEEARRQLETMVVAPIRLARLALPAMREAGEGRIVNVSSLAGLVTTPLLGWYQACKHALEGLSDALRVEVAASGVKVILIEPGSFRTGIWKGQEEEIKALEGSPYAGAYKRSLLVARLAKVTGGDPAAVARVIARAVQSRRPRARYLVGLDAQWMAVGDRLTPTALRDRAVRLVSGLDSASKESKERLTRR